MSAYGQKRSVRVWFTPRQPPPPPSSPAAPAVAFGCNILQSGTGQEEFNVTTTGGGSYSGPVNVSFYDYPGSGHIFPPTSVQGATPAQDEPATAEQQPDTPLPWTAATGLEHRRKPRSRHHRASTG